jgi:hypothetical protein
VTDNTDRIRAFGDSHTPIPSQFLTGAEMMITPDRLTETLKALSSVCDPHKDSPFSPSTLFYLAQIREVLQHEVEQLENAANHRSVAA